MIGIRVNDREYEPTRRMEMYNENVQNARWHIQMAMSELGLAVSSLDNCAESHPMDVYSTFVEMIRKDLDRIDDNVQRDFEEWYTDENVVANHHFWSEDFGPDEE